MRLTEANLNFALHFIIMIKKIIIHLFIILVLISCNNTTTETSTTSNDSGSNNGPAAISFSVVNAYPHDTTSFTEGFLVHDGQLYESTGHTDDVPSSRSLFGTVDLKTGKIIPKVEIGNKYFGEGITFLKGKVYEMTLDAPRVCFVYDARTFKKLAEYPLNSEGWGMTTDGTYLIRSDGSSNLSYHDPNNFRLVKVLGVTDNNGSVSNINELEYINGFIYANQWQTNYILKIDTSSGKVVGRLDLSSLAMEAKNKYPDSNTLNGIAYDSATKKVYVTGKLWPNIYEIKFNN